MDELKIRDLRKKDQYKIDDAYLNGYARLCGIYATAVYNSLSRHADFHTQECFPSIEKIAEQHNISKPSVIKGIKQLEKWGIVSVTKEKDGKTKRQLPNVYILLDKSEWKPKPDDTRVNDIDSEIDKSRVNENDEPGKRQSKSRVNDVYCKDTQFKDNTVKDNNADKSADASKNNLNVQISQIIKEMESVDIKNKNYYGNTTQRNACKFIIENYSFEDAIKLIKEIPKLRVTVSFFPSITTPCELRDKWVKAFEAMYRQNKNKKPDMEFVM